MTEVLPYEALWTSLPSRNFGGFLANVGRPPKPTAIDLFCGCGGLTQGLRDAGFRVVAGVDIDSLALKAYRANHRSVRVWSDPIEKLKPTDMMRRLGLERGDLDLLAGCPPCQAFSTMPNRNGGRLVRDKKIKDLALRFVSFVQVMLPKTIMMENVPGLVRDRRMRQVRRRLARLGYVGRPMVFNAADYGVPQRRRRMVFIASRVGEIEYAVPVSGRRKTVRAAITGLSDPSKTRDPLHKLVENRQQRILDLIRRIPKDGGSRSDLGKDSQLECHQGFDGFYDVYGRMAWDDVSPTITGGCINPSKGRFLHPEQDRTITLREAALLQGFPKRYYFPTERGKYPAAQLIGNAFPPPFATCHALRIRERLASVAGPQMQKAT